MSRAKLTTEAFIKKAKEVHGDTYDYSKLEYKGTNYKVKIICPIHGEFEQDPSSHRRGFGCRECGNIKKGKSRREKNRSSFIEKAKKIHGDKYDYSLIKYEKYSKKITVICKLHGEFRIRPSNFLWGQGCRKCAYEYKASKLRISNHDFLIMLRKKFGYKFEYPDLNKLNLKDSMTIICKNHGKFITQAESHLRSKYGCKKCADEMMDMPSKLTQEGAKKKIRKVWGDRYILDDFIYKNVRSKCNLTCGIHGPFSVTFAALIWQGKGCHECGKEIGRLGDTVAELKKKQIFIPGSFYLIECILDDEKFFKVGITTQNLLSRYGPRGRNTKIPYEYKLILQRDIGLIDAYELEQSILKKNPNRYIPKIKFAGWTECLNENPFY